MGLFGGGGGRECKQTWRKAEWNETAQNSKTEGGIERKNKKM